MKDLPELRLHSLHLRAAAGHFGDTRAPPQPLTPADIVAAVESSVSSDIIDGGLGNVDAPLESNLRGHRFAVEAATVAARFAARTTSLHRVPVDSAAAAVAASAPAVAAWTPTGLRFAWAGTPEAVAVANGDDRTAAGIEDVSLLFSEVAVAGAGAAAITMPTTWESLPYMHVGADENFSGPRPCESSVRLPNPYVVDSADQARKDTGSTELGVNGVSETSAHFVAAAAASAAGPGVAAVVLRRDAIATGSRTLIARFGAEGADLISESDHVVWLFVVEGTYVQLMEVLQGFMIRGGIRSDLHKAFSVTDKLLGSGGMCKVFLGLGSKAEKAGVWDPRLRPPNQLQKDLVLQGGREGYLAVKMTQKSSLLREVPFLVSVQKHPNIVHFLGAFRVPPEGTGPQHWSVVLQQIPGGDLHRFIINSGPCSEGFSAEVMICIISALEHTHSLGIVHRDVKAENVMIGAQGQLVLADFDTAAQINDAQAMQVRCGSPGCVAPEMLDGRPYNAKVDLFSAGVLLFYSICGRLPFNGGSISAVLRRNLKCKVKLNQEQGSLLAWLTPTAKEFLFRLMAKEPTNRPTAKEAMEHCFISGRINRPEARSGVIARLASAVFSPPTEAAKPVNEDGIDRNDSIEEEDNGKQQAGSAFAKKDEFKAYEDQPRELEEIRARAWANMQKTEPQKVEPRYVFTGGPATGDSKRRFRPLDDVENPPNSSQGVRRTSSELRAENLAILEQSEATSSYPFGYGYGPARPKDGEGKQWDDRDSEWMSWASECSRATGSSSGHDSLSEVSWRSGAQSSMMNNATNTTCRDSKSAMWSGIDPPSESVGMSFGTSGEQQAVRKKQDAVDRTDLWSNIQVPDDDPGAAMDSMEEMTDPTAMRCVVPTPAAKSAGKSGADSANARQFWRMMRRSSGKQQ